MLRGALRGGVIAGARESLHSPAGGFAYERSRRTLGEILVEPSGSFGICGLVVERDPPEVEGRRARVLIGGEPPTNRF